MFDEFLAQNNLMSQLSNHLVAERLAFVGCQSQMVPKLLFLWRWFRGCAPHNLHRTVAWDCCLGEARWWKMGHETTLGCLEKKNVEKTSAWINFVHQKKKVQTGDWTGGLLSPNLSRKKKTCFVNWKNHIFGSPKIMASKRPLANVDQVIHPDRYLQTCTNKTTPDTIHDSLNMVTFSLPKIREVQKHQKKSPSQMGYKSWLCIIGILPRWYPSSFWNMVLLHSPPPPTTKISTNPWNFFPHRCGARTCHQWEVHQQ